jgi:hypothetical protein
MHLEDLFNEIVALGWRIDLTQPDDVIWLCKLHTDTHFTNVYISDNPTQALRLAIDGIPNAQRWDMLYPKPEAQEPALDLRAQLSHLLRPKLKGLVRRV